MSITTAISLYNEALAGKALTTSERRSVIYFLQTTKPTMTDDEIAELFSISLKKLNKDKLEIKKRLSDQLKQTTVELIVADVHDAVKRTLQKLENNVAIMETRKLDGSDSYTRAASAALDGWIKYYKIAQDMGVVPKDTTPERTTEYVWTTTIGEDGRAISEQKIITKQHSNNHIELVTNEQDKNSSSTELTTSV